MPWLNGKTHHCPEKDGSNGNCASHSDGYCSEHQVVCTKHPPKGWIHLKTEPCIKCKIAEEMAQKREKKDKKEPDDDKGGKKRKGKKPNNKNGRGQKDPSRNMVTHPPPRNNRVTKNYRTTRDNKSGCGCGNKTTRSPSCRITRSMAAYLPMLSNAELDETVEGRYVRLLQMRWSRLLQPYGLAIHLARDSKVTIHRLHSERCPAPYSAEDCWEMEEDGI